MVLFAQRAFDLLAALGQAKLQAQNSQKPLDWGSLHAVLAMQPHESPQDHQQTGPKNLPQAFKELTQLPYLEYLHASQLLPYLSQCPKDTLGYLIGWLPERLQKLAIEFTGEKPQALPTHALARQFIFHSWAPFFDALETTPVAFAPASDREKLLKLDERALHQRAIAMAIFALEPQLKYFIDSSARSRMKQALENCSLLPCLKFIRFLRETRKDLSQELPYRFPLHLWDGSPQNFDLLCEKFGFACLARVIQDQGDDFKHELGLHVGELYRPMLECHTSVTSQVQSALLKSLELTDQFLMSTSA